MALPLAPIAALTLRYGSVALAAYVASKKLHQMPRSQAQEDALDRVDEGLGARREAEQTNFAGRYRRVIAFKGQRYEIDATGLGRVLFRKLK